MSQATYIVPPLSAEQQQQVIDQTHVYIEKAGELYNIKSSAVEISFNLKGRSAGMYRVRHSNRPFSRSHKREIRYNSFIFSKYFADNFSNTIPHEVAHYVCDIVYGLKNVKPHGKEWKGVMHLFGADPSVTADYDLSGIPLKKQNLFTYRCACREHQLSSIRHNKINKKRCQYLCNYCKQVIQYKADENKYR